MTSRVLQPPLAAGPVVRPGTIALGAGTAALAAVTALTLGPAALGLPLAVAGVVLLVRHPIVLLTTYVYIGLFKEQALLRALPVDVTLALGVVLVGVCVSRWLQGRARPLPFGLAAPVAVICVALLASLAWTPSPAYGGDKAFRFLTITLLATIAPFFLVEKERDLRRYLSWTVVMAAVAAVLALAGPRTSDGRLTVGIGGNTIGIGHLLCTAAIILLLGALTDLLRARIWALAASVAFVGVAAGVGSRGPLLSFVLALLVTGAVWLARAPRKVVPVLLIVVLAVAVLPFISLPQSSGQRLDTAVTNPVGALQVDPRYTTFGEAIRIIKQHPLVGIGSGGFESVGSLAKPPEQYPHNMILEVWSELGLVAVVGLSISIIVLLSALWRGAWQLPAADTSCRLLYVVIGVLLSNFFAAELTGDLNDNRTFWCAFGLAWLIAVHGMPPASDGAPDS